MKQQVFFTKYSEYHPGTSGVFPSPSLSKELKTSTTSKITVPSTGELPRLNSRLLSFVASIFTCKEELQPLFAPIFGQIRNQFKHANFLCLSKFSD